MYFLDVIHFESKNLSRDGISFRAWKIPEDYPHDLVLSELMKRRSRKDIQFYLDSTIWNAVICFYDPMSKHNYRYT